jgi:hypothetical protein
MKPTRTLVALLLALSVGCAHKSRIIQPSTPPPGLDEPTQTSSPMPSAPSTPHTWNWDDLSPGPLPAAWRVAETKSVGKPATWAIVADPGAPSPPNVLALTETRNRAGTFNLLLATTPALADIDLTVKLKANSGEEDQGGGPVWRARDGDNYYVCRLNPLESNYRVYKVVSGKREQLASADTPAKTGEWHTLRAVMKGDKIECYLDGQKLLEASDHALPDAGMIGLWTKADAATSFDDLSVRAAD